MHKYFQNMHMDISKRIIDFRLKKGMRQSEMASALDLSQSSYSRIENNADNLTISQLERVAEALGVSMREILFGEKEGGQEDVQVLKNRIAELESIIIDKSRIINGLGRYDESFSDFWYYFTLEIADKYDFKVFDYESEKGWERLTIKEYLKLPRDIRHKVFIANDVIEFEKEDKEKLYMELVQTEPYVRAIMLMDACGFQNDDLSKAIRRYGRYDFMRVAKEIGDFMK